jgi:cell cycle sensor histidine kinase DivJ
VTRSPDVPASALGTLGHELRTPLAAIIGYADAMRTRALGPLDETYADAARTIHDAATHMLALVDDLAAFAGTRELRESRSRRRLDAREPIEKVVRLMRIGAEAAGVTLAIQLPSTALLVDADDLALRQIAINLIANAMSATPKGGRVAVALAREANALLITVTDTGRGLVPGGPHGQGIGLRLVGALSAAHGGGFGLEPAQGGGTVAIVRLPIIAAD